ncbi:MAG: sulfatase-like hydrolase/transferase [Gammaproteobacteria bacterium]|nr:sulfatase-like hydrolase/transferase [Gammaproteobacteria bacterium]
MIGTSKRYILLNIILYLGLLAVLFYIEDISYSYKDFSNKFLNGLFGLSLISLAVLIFSRFHIALGAGFVFLIAIFLGFITYFSSYYGVFIDIGSFASIADSNFSESMEYMSQLDFFSLKVAIVVFILCLIIGGMILANKKNFKQHVFFLSLLFLVVTTFKVISAYDVKNNLKEWVTASFSHHFTFDSLLLVKDYISHKSIMDQEVTPSWKNVKYIDREEIKTYVVVIGESADRKHMTLYGYDRKTTPVLEDFEGMTLITDPISPAAQTRNSLPRMLLLNDKQGFYYDKSIVDLAKMAGFETHWISNQGYIGKHDTPSTKIASSADYVTFLNKSDFSKSNYDYHLLSPLKASLQSHKRKVIFVHLLGSHPEFCSRVWEPVFAGSDDKPKDVNCYDDSINNTMQLLSQIMAEVKKVNGKLIYTSDHGVAEVEEPPYLVHGVGNYFSIKALEVPLFIWDSNKKNNSVIDKTYFMRNFVHTLASFLNIESDDIDMKLSIIDSKYQKEAEGNYALTSSGKIKYFE